MREMVQWIAAGKGSVYIEINKEKLLPVQEILPDVYCFAVILFAGEKCQYRIFRGEGTFAGERAYEEFQTLAEVFDQTGPGCWCTRFGGRSAPIS